MPHYKQEAIQYLIKQKTFQNNKKINQEFVSNLPSQCNPLPLYPGKHVHAKLPRVFVQ